MFIWALGCVYGLWGYWAYMVVDLGCKFELFGLTCYWILFLAYLNFFDLCWVGFSWCLDGCFGTVLRMGETWKQLEQLKIGHGLGWPRTEIFRIKKEKGSRWWRKGDDGSEFSQDLCIFFLSFSRCNEVERFWFVFFELCLGSYGESMLKGLHSNVIYLFPSFSLFIYFCIHWFLFLFVISVYVVFLLVDVNVIFLLCIFNFYLSYKYLTFILVFMYVYLVSMNFYYYCAYHCSYLFILC